mgnify:CR=1 FL=1
MPGDGLALAVGVGGEDDLRGLLDQVGQFGDVGGCALEHDVGGSDSSVLKGDAEAPFGGEVAHVTEGGGHAEARAEELADLADLVGGLDDDQFHTGRPG